MSLQSIWITRIKNITVFQVLMILLTLFIGYASIDVVLKVSEQRKYDMQRLCADIQKQYPKSTMTFQNIHIMDNDLKRSAYPDDNGNYDTYYESKYVYIRGNQLCEEPNFLWVLYGIAPLIFLTIFHQDPRTLKVKDLHQLSWHTTAWVLGSLILMGVLHLFSQDKYDGRRYLSPDKFSYETEELLHQVNLSSYKILSDD